MKKSYLWPIFSNFNVYGPFNMCRMKIYCSILLLYEKDFLRKNNLLNTTQFEANYAVILIVI